MPKVRSSLYGAARALGDVNAVRRGPGAVVKRQGRKAVGRIVGAFFGRLFR